jgi:hypothetical protein
MGPLGGPPHPEEPASPPGPADRPDARHYVAVQDELTRLLEAVTDQRCPSVGTLQRLTTGLARAVTANDDLLLLAMEGGGGFDLERHLVNVTIYAVKIGQGAGCREEELPWLALCASLHDLGMLAVPAAVLHKPGPLTAEERAQVRRHPEIGFRVLQALGPAYEAAANVALQEHERDDGSGYPKGLRGEAIHEYAKIIGLADAYEALTHARPYREPLAPSDAVKELIAAERRRFPDAILKGLIRALSTAPVGSLVRLNTHETARVVATNPHFPLRPVVEVVAGPKGEPLDAHRRIDLAANTLLYITDASLTRLAP